MAKTNSLTHAPFIDGDLLDFVHADYPHAFGGFDAEAKRARGEWRENKPFQATLYYHGYTRGQSSTKLVWEDADGNLYPMFMSSFDEAAKSTYVGIRGGDRAGLLLHGTFQVVKRGANYGIALVNA